MAGNKVKLLTKQEVLNQVAERWKAQYRHKKMVIVDDKLGPDKDWMTTQMYPRKMYPRTEKIYEQLIELPLYPTEEQINEIIGNNEWTKMTCAYCRKSVDKLLLIDTEPSQVNFCEKCLRKAVMIIDDGETLKHLNATIPQRYGKMIKPPEYGICKDPNDGRNANELIEDSTFNTIIDWCIQNGDHAEISTIDIIEILEKIKPGTLERYNKATME